MRHYKTVAVITASLVALTALSVAGPAGAKKKKKKKAGPVVVGTDPEGDWGSNADPTLGPIGEPLGQDLVEAVIDMADKETVNFVIKVTSLPAPGGMPELTRYTWNLSVDGELVELDGKYTNYSRGACDPTSGNCPPPRDPGAAPFLVRGNCASNGAAVVCEELGKVEAAFDPAKGTITIPVPLEMMSGKPGSLIAGATQADSGFSGVSAAPSAFYSHSSVPYDTMTILTTYKVPKK